jgi:hypothetical protein
MTIRHDRRPRAAGTPTNAPTPAQHEETVE